MLSASILRPFFVLPWLVLTVLVAMSGCDSATHDEPAVTLEQQVDAYVHPYLELGFFNGAVLIARGDDVLLKKAYGQTNYAQQVPNTPQSQFRIASVSKPFTKMAIGALWEDGQFDLSTTVDAFVPDFVDGDQITIEHLLQDRSGIPHINDLPWYDQFTQHDYSLDELIGQFKHEPLDFAPGTQHAYSNGAYALMALIIEQASGQSYGAYLQEHVFRPLGMTDSGHDRRGLTLPRRATGHYPGVTALDERVPAPYVEMSLKVGGGSLYSAVEDLYRWDRALFGDNVLRPSTYEMLFPASDGTLAFSGRQPGFNAYYLRRMQEDVTVIVLSNTYASGMLMEMSNAFAAMTLGRAYDPPLVRTDVAVSTAVLAAYTGRYQVPDGTILEVRLDGENLVVYEDDQPQEMLVPVSDDRFIIRVAWAELTFVKGSGGVVSHVQIRFLVDDQEISLPRLDA